jgi:site-specific recombinase XerD
MNAPSNVPVITIFVRHANHCKYQGDETCKRCDCRKHLRWTANGVQYRRSAKTRSWAEAEHQKRHLIEQLSAGNAAVTPSAAPTIHSLVEVFVMSKESQRIGQTTVQRHRRELKRLADFLAENGIFVPAEINGAALYKFRDTWSTLYPASSTQREAQQRIRQFLRFLHDDGYLHKLPRLTPIKDEQDPTMPLDAKQYKALLNAIPKAFEHEGLARRMRAVVRLMCHSGLAIGDAVTLKRDSLVFDKKKNLYRIVTSRQKTGTHVSVLIPTDVAKELLSVANGNPEYVLWDHRGGQKKTVVKDYQKDFRRLFLAAGLGNFASHSLRDTFSVDLLERGVPLEEVSKLLGHSSTKVTEKHYAPWISGRQERLDSFMLPVVRGKKTNAA